MNEWKALYKKRTEEFNAFPIHFAFGKEQWERKIKELGLDPEHYEDQITGVGGGGFILNSDIPAFKEMCARHRREKEEAFAKDTTGDGIIYQMFYAALIDTEYGYTGETDDAVELCGYTYEDLEKDHRLSHALEKAAAEIRKKEGFEW